MIPLRRPIRNSLLCLCTVATLAPLLWKDRAAKPPGQPAHAIPLPEPVAGTGKTAASEENLIPQAPSAAQAETTNSPAPPFPTAGQRSLNDAIHAARYAVSTLLERQAAEPRNAGVRFFASNPAQRLTARFMDNGVRIASGQVGPDWQATLSLTGNSSAEPEANEANVRYRHGNGITESFDNLDRGIEHSFVVDGASANSTSSTHFKFMLSGLTAERDPAADGNLRFVDASGEPKLGYRSLQVEDAAGVALAARMEPTAGGFDIVVDTRSARYPLRIDPLIVSLEQRISGEPSAAASTAKLGSGLALDGDTAMCQNGDGVMVFARDGSGWHYQSTLYTNLAADIAAGSGFGQSISLKGDVVAIGAPSRQVTIFNIPGSVFIFRRTAGAWALEKELMPADLQSTDDFGNSVAISGDDLLVGAYRQNSFDGGAYFFSHASGDWQMVTKVTAPHPVNFAFFGWSVAIDGDHAAVGAMWDTPNDVKTGCVYTYSRSGSAWIPGQALVPAGSSVNSEVGRSIAISDDRLAISSSTAGTDVNDPWAGGWVYRWDSGSWALESNLPASKYGVDKIALSGNIAFVASSGESDASATLVGNVHPFIRNGSTWTKQQSFHAPDSAAGDQFGASISLSGTTLVALSPGDETLGGADAGSLHFFDLQGAAWVQTSALDGGPTTDHRALGAALAMNATTALVGAPGEITADGPGAGSAYVFNLQGSQWTLVQKLFAPVFSQSSEEFGTSVALDGDTAVVGAAAFPSIVGEVHVFRKTSSGWVHEAELKEDGGVFANLFGANVAVSGNTVLAGAWRTNDSGVAYLYERTGSAWNFVKALLPPDAQQFQQFGYSVALRGSTAFVGAPGPFSDVAQTCSVYVYGKDSDGWNYHQVLRPGTLDSRRGLGTCLAASGDTLLAGAPDAVVSTTQQGRAFVYHEVAGSWELETALQSPLTTSLNFGSSVGVYYNTAVVGASADPVGSVLAAGVAQVFERTPSGWTHSATFTEQVPVAQNFYAKAVAIWGQRCLVGSQSSNGIASTGAVVPFEGRVDDYLLPELVPVLSASSTFTLNRQTGLMEQTVTVTNNSTEDLSGFDLLVLNLPAGVELNNGSANAAGQPLVQYRQPIPAGTSQNLILEYYVPGRNSAGIIPSLSFTMNLPTDDPIALSAGLAINRVVQIDGGALLVEFSSSPGSSYEIQYSNDGVVWNVSPIPIKAAGNRVQWIDRGLPRTTTPPSSQRMRLYRVRELSAP